MIVAEVNLTEESFGGGGIIHTVKFNDAAKAAAEYTRVADLLQRRGDRANDLPKIVEVDGGSGNKLSLPLEIVRSVGLVDFAQANAEAAGVRDAFPNLFKV